MANENVDLNITVTIAVIILVIAIITTSITLRRLMMYSFLLWKKKQIPFTKILDGYFVKVLILTVIFYTCLYSLDEEWRMMIENYLDGPQINGWLDILVTTPIVLSLFLGCLISLLYTIDSCEVDLVQSQSEKTNIGKYWALMAYNSYFKVVFEDWLTDVEDYNRKYPEKQLDSKNLILLCPLSCNIDKTLEERFDRIKEVGFLEDTECDQGANINRTYRKPIYQVGSEENAFHLVAQFPSSFGTLWQVRDSMPLNKWLYHRESFVTMLKKLMKDCPCTILEYDDTNESSQEPLDSFLISQLNLRRRL